MFLILLGYLEMLLGLLLVANHKHAYSDCFVLQVSVVMQEHLNIYLPN
nr:MAG TPA: hypothetical protein [Caudoviricetes sp.]